MEPIIRLAQEADVPAILGIYNQGIEDRIATLEAEPKDLAYMLAWFRQREPRHVVLVALDGGDDVIGWAAIAAYNGRCAYRGVGELSIYVRRDRRGQGLGQALLAALEAAAIAHEFRKLVLFTFAFNALGQGLYRKMGYREVGTFREQGILDGAPVDVMAMEKLLAEAPRVRQVLFACVHNTGRSQMAEAFFNRLADPAKARAISGGTEPATGMNPTVIAVMEEVGIDLLAEGHHPKIAELDRLAAGDLPISMGCGVELACPVRLGRMADWGLADPKGQPLEAVRSIRDEIRRRVEDLVSELGARRTVPSLHVMGSGPDDADRG